SLYFIFVVENIVTKRKENDPFSFYTIIRTQSILTLLSAMFEALSAILTLLSAMFEVLSAILALL
ncbi:hypothetical protein ACIQ7N_18925, partial [Lysinibacillus sp. NPDC095746]|uniref:hypothetical protein n=1 Tax=Lysinibacillus sp. NPDC095746 TaxID=3364134 RepID=UPI0038201849